jgi:hypothetical protein
MVTVSLRRARFALACALLASPLAFACGTTSAMPDLAQPHLDAGGVSTGYVPGSEDAGAVAPAPGDASSSADATDGGGSKPGTDAGTVTTSDDAGPPDAGPQTEWSCSASGATVSFCATEPGDTVLMGSPNPRVACARTSSEPADGAVWGCPSSASEPCTTGVLAGECFVWFPEVFPDGGGEWALGEILN